MKTRRSAKLLAAAAAASLLVAACGGDDDDSAEPDATTGETTAEVPATTTGDTEAPAPTTGDTEAPETTTGDTEAPGTTAEGGEGGGMTLTYTLSDAAVWSDGTPFSAADFECTVAAVMGTPGSLSTTGYDVITGVTEGATPQEIIVEFSSPFAAWKTLFSGLLKADAHADCNDVSADFPGAYSYGAGPYVMTEWTAEQAVYEKNPNYAGANTGGPDRVVIVPAEDGVTALKSGLVDFIYPQAYTGIDAELADPNVAFDAEPGGQYEGLYFQQDDNCTPDETRSCALADETFREAFSKSIDLEGLYEQIYAPFAQGLPLLECGPIAPGPYCDPVFTDTYDPEGAAGLLEEAGWAKDASGFWAMDGAEAPVIHWVVNTGNTRRESAQEYLIPLLESAGFNVDADNCEATPCVFQTRLPALKYDMAMFINTVTPDPIGITQVYTCDQIPTAENNFQGQNQRGWCNEEATELLHAADAELDEDARAELVKSAIALMAEDFVLLPTLQFPNIGAYRTDKVNGTQNNLANYWAFNDWYNFEDLDGDGQVVIGAEQFPVPDCANPVTDCSNSSWFQWVAGFPTFPGLYATTNDQTFEPSEYLTGEAVLEEL